MKLAPHQILQKLGFNVPPEGVEVSPNDSVIHDFILKKAGQSITISTIRGPRRGPRISNQMAESVLRNIYQYGAAQGIGTDTSPSIIVFRDHENLGAEVKKTIAQGMEEARAKPTTCKVTDIILDGVLLEDPRLRVLWPIARELLLRITTTEHEVLFDFSPGWARLPAHQFALVSSLMQGDYRTPKPSKRALAKINAV